MAKFRKKSIVLSAVRIIETMQIKTLEGTMTGNPGDWLITGLVGELYPCKDELFRKLYEPVDQQAGDLMAEHVFVDEDGVVKRIKEKNIVSIPANEDAIAIGDG